MSEPCPWCPDGHEPPTAHPWAAWVDMVNVDHDGQPVRIVVSKTGEQHVAESDAEWVRAFLRGGRT